jgi:hypothetical protein
MMESIVTTESVNSPKSVGGAPKLNRNARKHDIHSARRVLAEFGLRAIDGRSTVGIALREFRAGVIGDLGGESALTTQQRVIVDLAVRSKLLVDSIDAWLLDGRSLINVRKRSLIPALRERTALADALARYLTMLGLERKSAPGPGLHEYQKYYAQKNSAASAATEPATTTAEESE